MKKLFLIGLILFCFFSCKKDSDSDSGVSVTSSLSGDWKCAEQNIKSGKIINYHVSISVVGNDTNSLIINNFNMLGYDFGAISMLNKNEITLIPDPNSGYKISGKGYVENSKSIKWDYGVDDGNGYIYYKAEYTR